MSRRLTRVREVSPDVSRRCHDKGIYTCRHLLELGPFAVRHELDLFGADARELLQAVSRATAPIPSTVPAPLADLPRPTHV